MGVMSVHIKLECRLKVGGTSGMWLRLSVLQLPQEISAMFLPFLENSSESFYHETGVITLPSSGEVQFQELNQTIPALESGVGHINITEQANKEISELEKRSTKPQLAFSAMLGDGCGHPRCEGQGILSVWPVV